MIVRWLALPISWRVDRAAVARWGASRFDPDNGTTGQQWPVNERMRDRSMRSDYEYGLGDTGLSVEATELVLYAENDRGNYKAYIEPMLKACQKHYDKGQGDYERVVAGFTRIFLPIARNYVLEHCGMADSVRSIFPPAVRRECGRYMAEYFLAEYHANGGGW